MSPIFKRAKRTPQSFTAYVYGLDNVEITIPDITVKQQYCDQAHYYIRLIGMNHILATYGNDLYQYTWHFKKHRDHLPVCTGWTTPQALGCKDMDDFNARLWQGVERWLDPNKQATF